MAATGGNFSHVAKSLQFKRKTVNKDGHGLKMWDHNVLKMSHDHFAD